MRADRSSCKSGGTLALRRLLVAILICAGCREERPAPKIISLVGRVESIKLNTGQVEFRFYHEERDAEVVEEGLVTKETEIRIDGRVVTLADVRRGDRANVVIRVEKDRGEIEYVATKVEISRGAPATQPAAPPGS